MPPPLLPSIPMPLLALVGDEAPVGEEEADDDDDDDDDEEEEEEEGAVPRMSQKRMVSSAEALHTVVPHGDLARCSTRDVWPRNSLIFVIVGYFQRISWLSENPWDETNSCSWSDH